KQHVTDLRRRLQLDVSSENVRHIGHRRRRIRRNKACPTRAQFPQPPAADTRCTAGIKSPVERHDVRRSDRMRDSTKNLQRENRVASDAAILPGVRDEPKIAPVDQAALRSISLKQREARETAKSEEHTSELQSREKLVCRL